MSGKKKDTGKSLSKAAIRMLGRRSFQAGRTQNILISMAVVIVTILITAACSVFYNIQRFGQMQELKETGAMTDVVLSGPDGQQLALLSESALVQQPLFVSHKVGRLVGNPGQSGLSLYLYAEENWDTWSRPLFTMPISRSKRLRPPGHRPPVIFLWAQKLMASLVYMGSSVCVRP